MAAARQATHPALPPAAPQGMACKYPPGGGRGAVSITAEDLDRLEVEEFLNDTIIDFYIK